MLVHSLLSGFPPGPVLAMPEPDDDGDVEGSGPAPAVCPLLPCAAMTNVSELLVQRHGLGEGLRSTCEGTAVALFSLPQLLNDVTHFGAGLLRETADVHHGQQDLVVVDLL